MPRRCVHASVAADGAVAMTSYVTHARGVAFDARRRAATTPAYRVGLMSAADMLRYAGARRARAQETNAAPFITPRGVRERMQQKSAKPLTEMPDGAPASPTQRRMSRRADDTAPQPQSPRCRMWKRVAVVNARHKTGSSRRNRSPQQRRQVRLTRAAPAPVPVQRRREDERQDTAAGGVRKARCAGERRGMRCAGSARAPDAATMRQR